MAERGRNAGVHRDPLYHMQASGRLASKGGAVWGPGAVAVAARCTRLQAVATLLSARWRHFWRLIRLRTWAALAIPRPGRRELLVTNHILVILSVQNRMSEFSLT